MGKIAKEGRSSKTSKGRDLMGDLPNPKDKELMKDGEDKEGLEG